MWARLFGVFVRIELRKRHAALPDWRPNHDALILRRFLYRPPHRSFIGIASSYRRFTASAVFLDAGAEAVVSIFAKVVGYRPCRRLYRLLRKLS